MNVAKWDNLVGRFINERYRVQKEIGTGGAGKVYLAIDNQNGNRVALKTFNPNSTMSNNAERFRMEAKVLATLSHPNIVKFYDYFKFQDAEIIVMEYVDGVPLSKKIRDEKTIEPKDAIRYMKQLLSALSEIHDNKIYHRDIKPDNIQITAEDNIKLLDFGIVQESISQELTRQGAHIGTISYLSPEIIRNPSRKSNAKTDIYSAGVMFYEMITGIKPFVPDKLLSNVKDMNMNVASKILEEPIVSPKDLDPSISNELNHIICSMIEKKPTERYPNVESVLRDIKIVEQGEKVNKLHGYYPEEIKDDKTYKKQFIFLTIVGVFFILILLLILIITIL